MLAFAAFGSVAVAAKPQGRPPLVLWAVGPARLDETAQRAAAVVGTRAATSYGEQVAGDLAAGLAEHDVAVVSGGAYGIDGAAHRAALAVEGVTVAVLAGGIDIPYPAGHSGVAASDRRQRVVGHRISAGGAAGTAPVPDAQSVGGRVCRRGGGGGGRFAQRRGQHRRVGASVGQGSGRGARAGDLVGVDGMPRPAARGRRGDHSRRGHRRAGGSIGELAPEQPRPATPLDGLSDDERQVYEALPGRGLATVDEIAVAAALEPARILAPLAMLEVAGLAERHDGRWRIVRNRSTTA